jgi:23S rRNA (cytosine1962-C5)-methyltransferase
MNGPTDHELLDAGDARRLERFGTVVCDRPAGAALAPRRDPGAWRTADARFEPTGAGPDGWHRRRQLDEPWLLTLAGLSLELRLTDSGQVGVFPEHADQWEWVADRVRARPMVPEPEILHLFAYTGGASLAATRAGARVVHVDASRPAVAWARRNARRSGLADRPVRWLVDEARAFVAREVRRGRRYDGIVLDPPTYGHGPRGPAWRIEDDLDPLLDACAAIAAPGAFVLLTSHSPGEDEDHLAHRLATAFAAPPDDVEAGELELAARSGVILPLGAYARIWGSV